MKAFLIECLARFLSKEKISMKENETGRKKMFGCTPVVSLIELLHEAIYPIVIN